ncbi:MAG TPA: peptidylprolyl isomerase [Pseudonocardia sp.]|nr:peptidylprolyl isomerase [Pseudonocardia sp.]
MSTNQQRREAAKRKLERQQERQGNRELRRKRVAAITAAAVVLAVIGGTVLLAIGSGPAKPSDDTSAAPSDAPISTAPAAPVTPVNIPTQIAAPLVRPQPFPATVSCSYLPDEASAKPVNPPAGNAIPARGVTPVALTTSVGQIVLQLDRALAPCTVNSFVSLAQQGYFNNTSCHRLTTSRGLQVLQCGDPTGTGSGGPGYKFADETFPELKYGRGQVAMANAGPNTNGSQFFMIYGDGSALSPDYTVFGTISPVSLPLLDSVAKAGHDGSMDPSPGGGKPNMAVTITAAKVG